MQARWLGSCWDFDTLEVNQRWVFRFPRRKQVQARLRKDLALGVTGRLPWGGLADRLPAARPLYAWGELTAPAFPHVFSGYEKLPGVPAIELDGRAVQYGQLGRWLGRYLHRLHALKPPDALIEEATLTSDATTPHSCEENLQEYLTLLTARVGGASTMFDFLWRPAVLGTRHKRLFVAG